MLNREFLHSVFEDYDEAAGASRSRKAITKQTWTCGDSQRHTTVQDSKAPFSAPVCRLCIGSFHPLPQWQFSYDLVDNCFRMGGPF